MELQKAEEWLCGVSDTKLGDKSVNLIGINPSGLFCFSL